MPLFEGLLLLGPLRAQLIGLARLNHLLDHAVDGKAALQGLVPQLFIERPVKIADKTSVVRKKVLVDAALAVSVPAWSGGTFAE